MKPYLYLVKNTSKITKIDIDKTILDFVGGCKIGT
jgi:hypothetical protein